MVGSHALVDLDAFIAGPIARGRAAPVFMKDATMTDLVRSERSGTSAIVRMNRAEKQNALSRELFAAIDDALMALDGDVEIRGIVITGNENVFSTGGDLKEAL